MKMTTQMGPMVDRWITAPAIQCRLAVGEHQRKPPPRQSCMWCVLTNPAAPTLLMVSFMGACAM